MLLKSSAASSPTPGRQHITPALQYDFRVVEISPSLAHRGSAKHLNNAPPGGCSRVVWQFVKCKEAVSNDFGRRFRRRRLPEIAQHEQRHVIAPRDAVIEIDPMQDRWCGRLDIAFLGKLSNERIEHGFSRLDPATGQMPAADIAVLDKKHPAPLVDHKAANAERHPARKPPICMQYRPQNRL